MTSFVTFSSIQNNSASAESQSPQGVQDSPQPREIPIKSRAEVIDWLIAHNYPALPVAPAQDPHKYPKKNKKGEIEWSDEEGVPKPLYTGKNPSWVDENGIPHLVNHRRYQNVHPTPAELQKWFANPINGIGTLGGWNNTIWLDFDVKQFESQDKCDEAVFNCIAQIRQLTKQQPFIEETHSGGWRIGVRVKTKPNFTNFALTPGGTHVGEALGEGRFTVLAPTVGPSGNSYRNVARECLPEIESLEQIGIYPKSLAVEQKRVRESQAQSQSLPLTLPLGNGIRLEDLGYEPARQVLRGDDIKGDRSDSLTGAIKEWFGWDNWCDRNNIKADGTPENLAYQAALGLGIDEDRVGRILKTIDIPSCQPAAYHKGGEESCWKKIHGLDKPTFDAKCPAPIKDVIKAEWDKGKKKPNQSQNNKQTNKGFSGKSNEIPNSFNPTTEFTQFTLKMLYGDKPWICVDDKLYYWTGTHYKHSKDAVEIERISNWCDKYPLITKDPNTGEEIMTFPYAKPSKVRQAMEWVKMRLSVDPDLINPQGLNCTNGVIRIVWEDRQPSWRLDEHDPNLYYTYEPLVKYDPDANPVNCDRLLEALDSSQLDIFLKTIGASLDLETIRKYKGRLVRALLLKGHGSNGKDTVRELTSAMYGHQGMTGKTLADFAAYDEGRKFPLASLKYSRVNWASENANTTRLDKIQSLKAFITGDNLDSERKGKDEESFKPKGITLFNVNDTPNLQGTLEAIKGRYAVLLFNKTFKIGADPSKGELEADPRFKDDPEFLQTEVLPAFLNKVLDALVRLMNEGIDYSCTEKALEDIQAENSHLFQFCQDTNLGYNPKGTLTATAIWARLEQWYLENGTLSYEEGSNGKQKAIWAEQSKPSDRNVKAVNQVIARFRAIFPKAKLVALPHESGKKTVQALQGISFGRDGGDGGKIIDFEIPTPVEAFSTPVAPQSPPQQMPVYQDFHPTHPNFSTPSEFFENEDEYFEHTDPPVELKIVPDEQKKEMTPQQLGWVGCDDAISSTLGVEDWGATGVENASTGVENTSKVTTNDLIDYAEVIRVAKEATKKEEVAPDSNVDAIELEEAITPAQPQQTELPIYQRLDGNYELQSDEIDKVDPQIDNSSTATENVVEVADVTSQPSPPSPKPSIEVAENTSVNDESAPVPAETTQHFQKGDRVLTPQGEGEVLYFNPSWGEYNVALVDSTYYFKPEDLRLL